MGRTHQKFHHDVMRRGRGQQGHGIGANGKEGHVTQVQQAGQANDDVQSQAQQHVNAHRTDGEVPVLARDQWDQEEQDQ